MTLGRSSDTKGDVDVDLSKEGAACKVSRLQAQLMLGPGGGFTVTNVGRRAIHANGAPVRSGPCRPRGEWGLRRWVQQAALPPRIAVDALPLGSLAPRAEASLACWRPPLSDALHTPPSPLPPTPQLERGQSAPLPHLSLLEVGGVQLLFMVNALAVQRALARMEQLVM